MTTSDRLLCQKAYDLRSEGMNPNAISREIGVSDGAVYRWLKNPGKYDPYIDEIAVKRALAGDGKVYAVLTIWEREEFFTELLKVKESLFEWEWKEYVEALRKTLGVPVWNLNRGLRWRRTRR